MQPGWLLPVLDFLRRQSPNPSAVTLVNAGFSGHKLSTYLRCTHTKLPLHADLVLVDGASMPQEADGQDVEAVLRRVLTLPRAPAVILVHIPNWCWVDPHARLVAGSSDCYTSTHLVDHGWRRGARTEFMLEELAAFYSIPTLSLRRALFHSASTRDLFFDPSRATKDGTQ